MIFNEDGFYRTIIEHSLRFRNFKSANKTLVDYRMNDNFFDCDGIFRKIVSAPAEDALRSGFTLTGVEKVEQEKLFSVLEDLESEKHFSTALSWDRLHGGAAILILADDGGTLEEPLNEKSIRNIERLEVYSPEDLTFTADYFYKDPFDKRYGNPEFYNVVGRYGNSFLVHESRLLIFHGGIISNERRRARNGWGGTVSEQISDVLAHYKESLRLSVAALEKMSQDIMKLDGMQTIMQNDFGEEQIQKRLRLIDMYRHLENIVAIDTKDEYDRKNLSLSGVKDIIEQAMYALSAATGIPSTILFGRSPAGLSATGDADMENYYNLVGRIQKRTLRPNLMQLIYLIGLSSDYDVKLPETWSIAFNPLWNPSEKEKAETDKIIADTLAQKVNAAKTLVELGALDGAEVRKTVAESGDYVTDSSLDEILSAGVDE